MWTISYSLIGIAACYRIFSIVYISYPSITTRVSTGPCYVSLGITLCIHLGFTDVSGIIAQLLLVGGAIFDVPLALIYCFLCYPDL